MESKWDLSSILVCPLTPFNFSAFKLWFGALLSALIISADSLDTDRSNRIMSVRPDISITTTHSYEITYKYRWKCLNGLCGKM